MKITKRILVLLLTAVISFSAVIPAYARSVPSAASGYAGQMITVEFQYENIAGIKGTIEYTNPELFSNIKLSTTGLTSGTYNPNNGEIAYFGPTPVDCTITLILTLSEETQIGDTCKITFEYETTDDGKMPSRPDYKYDTVNITVSEKVDYTALMQIIAKAELFNKDDYTSSSWAFLELALLGARNALSATTQREVDKAYADLHIAIDSLVQVTKLNFDKLKEQIDEAESLNEQKYTAVSWANLVKALKNAKAALASTSQGVIDAATEDLKNAVKDLKEIPAPPAVDYASLIKQIKIALALVKTDYTAESWDKLDKALSVANSALESNSQSAVDDAAQALKNAIAGLVLVQIDPDVNYGELNRQIAIAESLVKSEYTPVTWTALESALNTAKSARSSNDQQVVNGAASALANAISALEKIQNNVDYTELNKQIAIAEGLDETQYTSASWENLKKYLDAAKAETESWDQSSVDAAASALKDAISVLVRMNFQLLVNAMDAVKQHADNEALSQLWYEMNEMLKRAELIMESGDQTAVDRCAKDLTDLLEKIIAKLAELKQAETVIIEKPVPTEPGEDYCNVESHRIWPVLFWISLALNIVIVGLIVVYYIYKRKKTNDNTPLVDYDIADDV